jgi:hypothetical protein
LRNLNQTQSLQSTEGKQTILDLEYFGLW